MGFGRTDRYFGIGFTVAGVAANSAGDAVTKLLASEYSVAQLVMFRSMVAILLIIPFMRGVFSVRTKYFNLHFFRSILILLCIACLVFSLRKLPLAQVIVLFSASSLIMIVLSSVLLREQVSARQWFAVVVGFCGVAVSVWPKNADLNWGVVVALVGAVLYALATIVTRWCSKTESTVSLIFWFSLISAAMTGISMPFVWITPPASDTGLLVALGVLAAIGQWWVVRGITLAPVSLLAPFKYLNVVFAVIFGWLLWRHLPTAPMVLGGFLIIASGIYIARCEYGKG